MYKLATNPSKTTISRNTSYQGETIEMKINRIINNEEPITDSAPLIYTDRKQGVQPDYNIRTDRWDHAIDAMDLVHKTEIAKRQERLDAAKNPAEKALMEEQKTGKNTGESQNTQGTK